MKDVSFSNFGLLIAFLLPGFMVLWGASYFSATISNWLSAPTESAPTVGGFMYVTLASITAGVTVSTVRWAVIDTIHGWTGLPQPEWDFSRLQENVAAYNVLNEIHYKFYQFHGNAEVALVFVYLARRVHLGFFAASFGWVDVGFLLLSVILFVGSRDTLRKYHSRVSQLLGSRSPVIEASSTWPEHHWVREPIFRLLHRHRSPHNLLPQRSSKNRSTLSLGQ